MTDGWRTQFWPGGEPPTQGARRLVTGEGLGKGKRDGAGVGGDVSVGGGGGDENCQMPTFVVACSTLLSHIH